MPGVYPQSVMHQFNIKKELGNQTGLEELQVLRNFRLEEELQARAQGAYQTRDARVVGYYLYQAHLAPDLAS